MANATQGASDEGQHQGAAMCSKRGQHQKKKKKKMLSGREDKRGKQCNEGCARDKIGERGITEAVLTFSVLD